MAGNMESAIEEHRKITRQRRLDEFARAALMGYCAGPYSYTSAARAILAYDDAEAMLAESEKRKG